ncbi:MAG: tetratricopeptide repeat protein [Terriglobales bacterium]
MTGASSRFPSWANPGWPGECLLLGLWLAGTAAVAQQPSNREPRSAAPAASRQAGVPTPATAELQKRRQAALAAQQSGNAEVIAEANQRLLAFSLRQMGQLRLLETAFPEAAELYRRSLEFEDLPDTHVDLAIAYLFANKLDDSIAQARKVISADPQNARAWNVQGKAWMKKQDPQKAAESLERAIAIHPDLEAAYSLGISLLAAKQKEKADAVFQGMLQAAGDSGPLRVLFARAYKDANQMDDTVRELKKAIALDPATEHAHYFLGLSYLMLNEWAPTEECRAEFLRELQYHPRDFLSNYFLGVIGSIRKQYDESDRYLRLATETEPSSPEAWLYLGLNAYGRQDTARAEEFLRRAIELAGTQVHESHYLIRKGYVVLGRILVNSGRREEGQRFLQKARELQNLALDESLQNVADVQSEAGTGMGAAVVPALPQKEPEASPLEVSAGDPTAQVDASVLARSNLTEEQKKQAAAQEKHLRSILASSFNDLATSEAVRQRYDLALRHYHEAERWDAETAGLMRNLGTAAFRLKDYPEAVRTLAKALESNSADNPARAMLGMAYYATNAYPQAARTIAPLGDEAMRDPAVGYAWAAALTRTGDLQEATKVLAEVEKAQLPTDTLLLVGQLWIDIADYARALSTMRRALQLDPNLRKAHYYAGLALLRADRPAEAVPEFQAELALVPDDPDATYSMGFAYLQQSHRDEAEALFRKVISVHPEHANAQYQLGKIQLDKGETTEAISYLEQAARLNPEADYIHYQLQAAYRKVARQEDADRELQLYRELKAKNRQLDIPKPAQDQ